MGQRWVWGLAWACVLAGVVPPAPADTASRGIDHEIWIAVRTDGQPGSGTQDDPFDGSTQARFDGLLHGLWQRHAQHITIHLGVGTFETVGGYVYVAYDPSPGWRLDDGWKLLGAGMGNTVIKLVGFSYLDPGRTPVAVTGGVWTAARDVWFKPGQELRLAEGRDLIGLQLGRTYVVCEALDARRFRVAETFGGPALATAAIGAGGQLNVIAKSAWNSAIVTNPWNKTDLEVRDLTVDGNWTGFGTTLTQPFTVPADLATVTVQVASSAWAQLHKWVYIQQLDYVEAGVYEVVAIPSAQQLVLRNLRDMAAAAPAAGQPDERFRDNLPAGRSVAVGARVVPRLNTTGVSLSAPRARVERVRVTNVGAPIYEGECGINVTGIGQPGPTWPDATDVVIRDCVVDNTWGHHGWPIQIHGNNTDWPSKGYAISAVVEGNSIYGNGLHQGLGGWNYANSVFRNNKVVHCQSAFFTDVGHCWNTVVSGNLFLQCQSYAVNLGGGPPLWQPTAAYRVGDVVVAHGLYYRAIAAGTGQQPPSAAWSEEPKQGELGYTGYVFEGNLLELCDNSGPVLFNGCVADTVFRNNIVRYAPGHSRGGHGLEFAKPTNRRLIVTGNVIDSRLTNHLGTSVVYSAGNIDELGRPRQDLDVH